MRPYYVAVVALVIALCSVSSEVWARDPEYIVKNSEGKEFWVCFMKNFRESASGQNSKAQEQLKLQLFLTSSFDARARISIDGLRFDTTMTIRSNTVVNLSIPPSAQLRAAETPERLAVHIVADTTISVYGLNNRYQTTDTYMGLPVQVLGTDYRVMGYTKLAQDLLSQFSVIATQDSTQITIVPTVATSGRRRANTPFTVTLRKGDVYTVNALWESIGTGDLTGSRVMSNKPIAVFSGHSCAYVPQRVEACNHLVEQIPPTASWGKHFYMGTLKERSQYTYRVVASEDDTKIFEDARLVAVLRAGEYFENLSVRRHLQITADRPVLLAQFSQGFKNGDSVGDPMMILVSPTQQFLREYRFATPINGEWHHYINVVAPSTSIGEIRLNGRRIDTTIFTILGDSRYSIAHVPVPFGTHVIKGPEPFGLYSYGFGFGNDAYDAYGNMAGQSFTELNKLVDSLAPVADGRMQREEFYLTVRDDRPMDRGIKAIRVVQASSLEAVIPKIDAGVPQVPVRIRVASAGSSGRLVLQMTDVADNVSYITICYMLDSRTERYVFVVNDGRDAQCAADQAWFAGGFASLNHTYHNADFSRTGNLSTPGTFGTDQGLGVGFGGIIGKRLTPSLVANLRLGLSTVGGTLLAADTVTTSVFDPTTSTVVAYQEGTTLSISAPYLDLSLVGEWYADRFIYLLAGVRASMPLGSAVTASRTILRPGDMRFPDGATERQMTPEALSSLATFNIGAMAGLGVTYPVSFSSSVFVEAAYNRWLTDVVDDASWKAEAVMLTVGLRYRW